jgi:hypothetical protein
VISQRLTLGAGSSPELAFAASSGAGRRRRRAYGQGVVEDVERPGRLGELPGGQDVL